MAVELPASEEESAARALIEQASAALAQRRRDIPGTFVAQLYGRSVPEDVVRYGADDIAALAERAYDFIAERAPGTPKIRCETVPLAVSGDRKAIFGDRDRQRRYAVPGRFGDGRDCRSPSRRAAGRASDVRRAARRQQAGRARQLPTPPKASARALSIFILRRSPTMRRATNSCARCKPCSARCGWQCRTGAPCSTASTALSPS